MKFECIQTGMKVADEFLGKRGWVTEKLKTRVKVRFLGEDQDETYNADHCWMLELISNRRV